MNINLLVQKILLGDEKAFELLVAQYQRLVYHVSLRILKDPVECDEVLQEVFITVFKKIHQFKFESKFSTWIASITYRQAIAHLKKGRKLELKEIIDEEFMLNESHVNNQSDLKKALDFYLDKLPVLHRTALVFYHYEEMSYTEISKIMDLPEGTVKTYIFRARKALKEMIGRPNQQTLLYG